MRISTAEMQRQAINSILEQQSKINRLQKQMSTGERFSSPAEDPIAAVSVQDLDESLKITKQYSDNAIVAKRRLAVGEIVLTEMGAKLQRVRDLIIQADSDTTNNRDREIIAAEISLLRDELVELANSKDSNGEYMYSGYQSRSKPFTEGSGGTFIYNGDEGERFIQVGPTRQVSIGHSGKEAFIAIQRVQTAVDPTNTGTGVISAGNVVQPNDYQRHDFTISFGTDSTFDVTDNTTGQIVLTNQEYSSGETIKFNGSEVVIEGQPSLGDEFIVAPRENENVFNTMNNLVDILENAPASGESMEDFHENLNNELNNVDQSMERILTARTEVGGRLVSIDSQEQVNEAYSFQVEKSISELQGLDFVSTVSKFNLQLVALQSAQQAYLRVQGLTLFSQI